MLSAQWRVTPEHACRSPAPLTYVLGVSPKVSLRDGAASGAHQVVLLISQLLDSPVTPVLAHIHVPVPYSLFLSVPKTVKAQKHRLFLILFYF